MVPRWHTECCLCCNETSLSQRVLGTEASRVIGRKRPLLTPDCTGLRYQGMSMMNKRILLWGHSAKVLESFKVEESTGTSNPHSTPKFGMKMVDIPSSPIGMQKLIYDLSYLSARCSKSVSLVTPVYYAHLAAYRGQMLQEVARQAQSSSNSLNVADLLKNSMNFI
ncbi:argonaute 2-like protein [Tanacetum coccineum]